MTDTNSRLKDELSVLYPDVTDDDVNKLIIFFKLSAKALHEAKKIEKETQTTSGPWRKEVNLLKISKILVKKSHENAFFCVHSQINAT